MVSVFLKILFVKLTFSTTTTTTTTNLKIEKNSICISSKMLINSMVHKIYWQLTTLQYYSITPSYCCLLLLFKLQCKYLDQAMLCWLWSNYYYYPEKSLIYSFPFDPELRATNFSVKMMFSEAFQCSYLELKNSGPPGKGLLILTQKNRSATQNDREKKTKTNKTPSMRPPVSGGARWYETVTQWLDDHFTTSWCCERMELFYRKSQIPVSKTTTLL